MLIAIQIVVFINMSEQLQKANVFDSTGNIKARRPGLMGTCHGLRPSNVELKC